MSSNILSLLGLALRGGRLSPGDEPAALAAKTGQARLILLASDASERTARRAASLAQEGRCLWLTLPFSKEELGGALGRGGVAIAALTDTGLAAAVTERLAALDPERYAEAAARMDLKRRRAKERQSAPRRDPPKKSPPPSRESRSRSPKDSRRPEARKSRPPRDRKQDESHTSRPRGAGSYGTSFRGGGKRRPEEDGRRPYGRSAKENRSQNGKPPRKGRPYKNKGGPRSGGDRGNPAGGRGR